LPFAIVAVATEECETKMAAIASFKAMFRRIGFSEDAAGQLSSNDGAGLNTLETIVSVLYARLSVALAGLEMDMPCLSVPSTIS